MILLADPDATRQAGLRIAPSIRIGDIVALSGPLGAGKTSLARGILAGLGFLEGDVPSPSFALVIPYDPPDVSLPVAHVDLYRLDGPAEALQLGLDDMLLDGALIIEWPERLGETLWPEALRLHIEAGDDGVRVLTAQVPPSWEGRWPFR